MCCHISYSAVKGLLLNFFVMLFTVFQWRNHQTRGDLRQISTDL